MKTRSPNRVYRQERAWTRPMTVVINRPTIASPEIVNPRLRLDGFA